MEHTSSQLCLLFHLLFVTYIQSCGFYLLVISLVYPLLSILIFYHKCTSKMASLLSTEAPQALCTEAPGQMTRSQGIACKLPGGRAVAGGDKTSLL